MTTKNKKAFTLVEIMSVVLLSTVVFAGIYSTAIVGDRAWVYYNDSIAVKKEAHRAIWGMVQELRGAENVRIIESEEGSTIHFYRPWTGPVSYTWSREGNDAGRIIRRDRWDTRILAQHVSSVSFQNLERAVVIDITTSTRTTAGQLTQAALKEKVALRARTAPFRQSLE